MLIKFQISNLDEANNLQLEEGNIVIDQNATGSHLTNWLRSDSRIVSLMIESNVAVKKKGKEMATFSN